MTLIRITALEPRSPVDPHARAGRIWSEERARAVAVDVTVTSTAGKGSCFVVTLRFDSSSLCTTAASSAAASAVEIVDNGRSVVDAVMTVPYDVVLTAVTASTVVAERETCAAAGMESYLSKPVRVHELQTMLGRVCATIRPPGTTSVDNGLGGPGVSLAGVNIH